MPVFATSTSGPVRVESYLAPKDKPPKPPTPDRPTKTSVDIRNIPSGETVYSSVLIIAEVKGTFDEVVFQVDGGLEVPMGQVGSTERYEVTWETGGIATAGHTLTVNAKSSGSVVASDSVDVTVVTGYQWELYYEIDYITSNPPEQSVLEYQISYWAGHAIKVSYKVDQGIEDPNGDGIITSTEFWQLEVIYNDGDDNAGGNPNNGKYTLKEKWMLYGSQDSDPDVGGYTWVLGDGSAGNYIFIADSMIDTWESDYSIPNDGGEVTVVCHETGHSIGILVTRGPREKYDSDNYSVMSMMRLENAKYMAGYWYYSKEYWATRNMEYYTI